VGVRELILGVVIVISQLKFALYLKLGKFWIWLFILWIRVPKFCRSDDADHMPRWSFLGKMFWTSQQAEIKQLHLIGRTFLSCPFGWGWREIGYNVIVTVASSRF